MKLPVHMVQYNDSLEHVTCHEHRAIAHRTVVSLGRIFMNLLSVCLVSLDLGSFQQRRGGERDVSFLYSHPVHVFSHGMHGTENNEKDECKYKLQVSSGRTLEHPISFLCANAYSTTSVRFIQHQSVSTFKFQDINFQ